MKKYNIYLFLVLFLVSSVEAQAFGLKRCVDEQLKKVINAKVRVKNAKVPKLALVEDDYVPQFKPNPSNQKLPNTPVDPAA